MVPVQGGQVSLPKVPYWLLTLLLQQGAVQEAADTGGQPHMLMEELGVLIGAGRQWQDPLFHGPANFRKDSLG